MRNVIATLMLVFALLGFSPSGAVAQSGHFIEVYDITVSIPSLNRGIPETAKPYFESHQPDGLTGTGSGSFGGTERREVFIDRGLNANVDAIMAGVYTVTPLSYGFGYDRVRWAVREGVYETYRITDPSRSDYGMFQVYKSLQLRFTIPRDAALLEGVRAAIVAAHPWSEPVILVHEGLAHRRN